MGHAAVALKILHAARVNCKLALRIQVALWALITPQNASVNLASMVRMARAVNLAMRIIIVWVVIDHLHARQIRPRRLAAPVRWPVSAARDYMARLGGLAAFALHRLTALMEQ